MLFAFGDHYPATTTAGAPEIATFIDVDADVIATVDNVLLRDATEIHSTVRVTSAIYILLQFTGCGTGPDISQAFKIHDVAHGYGQPGFTGTNKTVAFPVDDQSTMWNVASV
jgi:hypothetical protein